MIGCARDCRFVDVTPSPDYSGAMYSLIHDEGRNLEFGGDVSESILMRASGDIGVASVVGDIGFYIE